MSEVKNLLVAEELDKKNDILIDPKMLNAIEDSMAIKGKLTLSSINQFFLQLETIVSFIKNLKGIRDMYKYSDSMQIRLNNELKELDFVLLEMSSILRNISSLRKQKIDVTKEVKNLKESYEKQYQEMELVAAIYDKDLLRKWHVAKKANDIQTMENFITSLVEKRQALEYVYKMATEKLTGLRKAHNNTPIMLQALFAKPLPPPIRVTESEPDTFLNTTD
ncbi:uncharacterized protein LOC106669573 isoform X2 [Cimex lectularius]|uniref:Uncharacterized protein n=1 Tax=Cimex lectularius TaxID=79782 RepID=A0A8I6RZS6_CIMLE|nr:uncharacterized protein LOC106669573 isoform X2 [Cimex lectularius]